MDRQEIIKTLQMDVEIPKVVQDRAQEAFDRIQATGRAESLGNREGQAAGGYEIGMEGSTEMAGKGKAADGRKGRNRVKGYGKEGREGSRGRRKGFPVKRVAVIFIAATFACAGITAAAVYFRWSRSMEEGMQITEQQKVQLEEEHAVAFAMQECTEQGVTITAEQSITDNYFAHIVFRVEGYELADGAEPAFESEDISVGGSYDFDWTASFYDGLITGPDGRAVYADGSPIDYESNESLARFVAEDGSMEFVVTLSCHNKGDFIDKPIHVELRNLGTVAKAQYLGTEVEAAWTFDWNLQGKDSTEIYPLEVPLGDSGAVVTMAELSPVSVHVEYNFPRTHVTEEGLDENGEPIQADMLAEPPMWSGVKMEDGTLYPYMMNGGRMGYESEDSETYAVTFATDRVIDVDKVESLLFQKSQPDGGGIPTEENFYVVPIK